MLEVILVPAFNDNYLWIGKTSSQFCFAVDPGDPEPIIDLLEQKGWHLDLILNTHHHPDHIGGNLLLKQKYQCPIWGFSKDEARLPGLDRKLNPNETLDIGDLKTTVLFIPGHTRGHIAFYFASERVCFVGDTLFGFGCGRLFEGSAEEMLSSLHKISALPEDTLIYCAHEYTESNLEFTLDVLRSLKLNWPDVLLREQRVKEMRKNFQPTVPLSLHEEAATNLFLNCHREDLQIALFGKKTSELEAFRAIRLMKDRWPPLTSLR